MAILNWTGPGGSITAPSSGSYDTASNWDLGGVPGQKDDVVFASRRYDVAMGAADQTVDSLTIGNRVALTASAGLQILSDAEVDGTLAITGALSSAYIYGAGTVSGFGRITSVLGSPDPVAGVVSSGLRLSATRGTLEIDAPTSSVSRLGNLLSGSGTIDLHAGSIVFDPGTRVSVANLEITGADVSLGTSVVDKGNFSLTAGSLSLVDALTQRHGNLTLKGQNTFGAAEIVGAAGQSPASVVTMTGHSTFSGGQTLADVSMRNLGTAVALGDLTLGNGTGASATFTNGATGVYDFASDSSILVATGGSGTFKNAGTVIKDGGTGTSEIQSAFSNSGTVVVASGTLLLDQTVRGAGTMEIDNSATLSLANGATSGQTVSFGNGGEGILLLGHASSFHATVANFAAGDSIDLLEAAFNPYQEQLSYLANQAGTGGTLTVRSVSGGGRASIALLGQYDPSGFSLQPDQGSGTLLTYAAPGGSGPPIIVS